MQIKKYDRDLGSDYITMRKLYNQWKQTANERIKTITKPRYEEKAQAYRHIVAPLSGAPYTGERHGRTVFRALPKSAGKREIREAFNKLTDFLKAKTSTVKGIKEVEKEHINIIKDITGTSGKLSDSDAERLLRFLGSEEGKIMNQHYDSDQIVTALAMSMSNNPLGVDESVYDRLLEFEESGMTVADWMREHDADGFDDLFDEI